MTQNCNIDPDKNNTDFMKNIHIVFIIIWFSHRTKPHKRKDFKKVWKSNVVFPFFHL